MGLVHHGMMVVQSGFFASPGLQIEILDYTQMYTPWQPTRVLLFV